MLFHPPPDNLCLVRLSSIGDIVHTLPVINTIQSHWQKTKITWIIGTVEHELVKTLTNIEFIPFNKKRGMRAYWDLRQALRDRCFDLMLLMQSSLRANLIPLFVRAKTRFGFDRKRAKNLHGLFVDYRIPFQKEQHAQDTLLSFTEALGMKKRLIWDYCHSEHDTSYIKSILPTQKILKILLLNPYSRHPSKNWLIENYAAVADYAIIRHQFYVVLTGSCNPIERRHNQRVKQAMSQPVLNLTGKTTITQLMALLTQATVLISPDSGPVHMANSVGTPVIGLYAATNPDRTAPYLNRQWCINRYPQAIREYFNKEMTAVSWGKRIRKVGAMQLIMVDDVTAQLDCFSANVTQTN